MSTADSGDGVRLERVMHPRRWLALLASALLLVALGFGLGARFTSPNEIDVPVVDSVRPVFATAEMRSFAVAESVTGTFGAASTVEVAAFKPQGTERAVVDRVYVKVGDEVRPGKPLVAISGRPLIALVMDVPLSRSLTYGDRGPDVLKVSSALSQAGLLGGAPDQVYGPVLRQAVVDLYAAAGFTPPTAAEAGEAAAGAKTAAPLPAGSKIEISEIQPIRAGSRVAAVPSAGDLVEGSDKPLLTLSSGAGKVTARVPVNSRDSFAVGQRVTVQVPGAQDTAVTGKVVAVSAFHEAGESKSLPGYDATIVLDKAAGFDSGQSVRCTATVDEGTKALGVPATAVREDSKGTFVQVAGSGAASTRVPVRIGAESDGWVAVTGEPLKAGDRVQVYP
ncbi:HlyD family efflux transporter periplasmic adaptor subunit [Actinomycetota bacterium]